MIIGGIILFLGTYLIQVLH